MVALHVPGAPPHGLRVGERGRVDEHEVEATARTARLGDPGHDVAALERVLGTLEPVRGHVAPRPVEVGLRQVHRGSRARPARSRMDRRRARVGEQVEEAPALRLRAHERAREAMVEEQAGVQIARQVHFEFEACLLHLRHVGAPAGLAVLPAALLAAAHLGEHVVGPHSQHDGHERKDVVEAAPRLHGIDAARRRVLRYVDVGVASRLARPFVHIDGHGIVGQVGIVDAVAGDAFAARPLSPFPGRLAQAGGELPGSLLEHLDEVLGAPGRIRHAHLGRADGRRIEHEGLRRHAPLPDLDPKGGRDAEALLHALAADRREHRSLRRGCRRGRERRGIGPGARLGHSAIPRRQDARHQAARGPVGRVARGRRARARNLPVR